MSSYRCVFIMGVERALEYRMSFFLSMLSAVFPILIQTTMWNYLYGHTDAASVFGYEQGQILLYTLLATIVSQLVGTGFEGEMNEDIKMGGLNKYLVRPMSYKWYQFFRFIGQKIPRLMVKQFATVMAFATGGGTCDDSYHRSGFLAGTAPVGRTCSGISGESGVGGGVEFFYLLLYRPAGILAYGCG